ncbi:MAG: TauD/TfdA family dioxygenase [Rhodospirillales bacterium]|jgi:taurine dioxygenase/putative 2-oxoglutarate oxygenase|nr:TauD/TfdA family dioxygenase [Rhodospirillales bacterium]
MTIGIEPLTDFIGARVQGIDMGEPLDADTMARLRAAWLQYEVLVFPRQTALTPEGHIAFTRNFGEPISITLKQYDLPEHQEIVVISNLKKDGKPVGVPLAYTWHTDGQHFREPVWGSILWGKEVPLEKGDTLFANMALAYDELPEETKRRIEGLKVLHSRVRVYPIHYPDRRPMTEDEKATMPDVVQPLVRTHPETGCKALYLKGNAGWEVVGMPRDEGLALLDELEAFATRPERVYAHRWEQGDAVFWDNRSTMHSATPYDMTRYRRVMYRTTIAGDVPY